MDGKEESGHLTLPAHSSILKAKCLQVTNRSIAVNISILEELADEHDVAMAKLREKLPASYRDYVDLADHFTQVKFDTLRNRILRTANDGRREMEETIDNLRLN